MVIEQKNEELFIDEMYSKGTENLHDTNINAEISR